MDSASSHPSSSTPASTSTPRPITKAMTNLVTLVFTDMVGSTALKQQLGDRVGATLMAEHHQLVRATLAEFPRAEEKETAGDSFFCIFTTPSEAVTFAILLQSRLRALNASRPTKLTDRIGIHVGEVLTRDSSQKMESKDIYGLSLDTCARVMSLADGGRILMTRPVYDSARPVLRWEEIPGVKELSWHLHGKYVLKGLEEPIEICEVLEKETGNPIAPASTEKVHRLDEAEEPAAGPWPPESGTVLLHRYQVGELVGAGGMGSVHRGKDLQLDRTIALKFVPAGLVGNRDRIERFKREARALAALNHPNVTTVYSVEETSSRHFISMEFVNGKPLNQLIPKEGFALREFLRIAVPLVEALNAAHCQGVVHRDLKPSNIMITQEQRLKVIDFGLAKMLPSESAVASGTSPPTHGSNDASLLGTPAYMSPEQAQGLPLDTRSDIFSLGILFHEMLTGQRPFTGESSAAIMSSVLRDTPQPLALLNRSIPDSLSRLVSKCLEKDPSRRIQTAQEVLAELSALKTTQLLTDSSPLLPAQPNVRSWMTVALPAIVAAFGVIAFLMLNRNSSQQKSQAQSTNVSTANSAATGPRFVPPQPLLVGPENEEWPAPSHDGHKLAFTRPVGGFKQIFVKSMDADGSIQQITSASADHLQPNWSPDDKELVYSRGVEKEPAVRASDVWGGWYSSDLIEVWVYNFATGKHRLILEHATSPKFNRDGLLAYASFLEKSERIWTCDRLGNQRHPVTEDPETIWHIEPSWSPDGKRIVFRRQPGKYTAKLAVVDLQTRKTVDLTDELFLSDPAWSPSGKYIYFTANLSSGFNLWRLPVKAGGQKAGNLEPVTFGTGRDLHASLSNDGKRLFYTILGWNSDIWAMPMDSGNGRPSGAPFPLVESSREDTRGDWSGDGRKIVFTSDRNGQMNLFTADFNPDTRTISTPVQITFGPGGDYQASWNPVGTQIAYFSRKSGNEDIWILELDEKGKPKGDSRQLTTHKGQDVNPIFSPDGKHIAYQSDQSGTTQLWVMDPDGGNKRVLSTTGTGGHYVRWLDANSIAFPSKGMGVAYLDGHEPEKRAEPVWAHMTFSSDKKFVADNDHTSIFSRAMGSDKFEKIFTFPDPNVGVDYTVWSPDGKFLLFDRSNPQGGDIYMLKDVE